MSTDVVMNGTEQPTEAKAAGEVPPAQGSGTVVTEGAAAAAKEEADGEIAPGADQQNVRKFAGKGSAKNGAAKGKKTNGNGGEEETGGKSFKAGDIVLTKLKGFPLWPSVVVDQNDIPSDVREQRPAGNLICTMFFPDGNYSWSKFNELTHLKPHDITSYINSGNKKRSGALFKGYKIAQDPEEFIQDKLEAVRRAENAKSAVAEDQDELENAEDEEETGGKKRKRADKKDQPVKKAKATKEPKSKTAVVEEEEDEIEDPTASKKKTKVAPKPKKEKVEKAVKAEKSSKAAPKSANKGEEAEDDHPLNKDPAAVKVKSWRHTLQRAFLGKNGFPSTEDMPTFNELFTAIEEYVDIPMEYLAWSKLGKVMKKLAALPDIPDNDQYKLAERADKLASDWASKASNGVSAAVAKTEEAIASANIPETAANIASSAADLVQDAAVAIKDAAAPVVDGIVEGAKDLVGAATEKMDVDVKEGQSEVHA